MKVTILTSALVFLASSVAFTSAYVDHGEVCNPASTTTDCNPNQDTACIDGTCQCVRGDEMEFDEDRNRCIVLVGNSCRRNDTTSGNFACPNNAYCTYNTRVCQCYSGYSNGPDGHCLASYGHRCNATTECNPDDLLTCNLGYCRCPNPMQDVWRSTRRRCYTRVGSSCLPNVGPNTITCDPEAHQCLADSDSVTGYSCQCKPGTHLGHYSRECLRDYNSECSRGEGTDWSELLEPHCDQIAGLRCFEGKCQCELTPDQAWDPATRACASLEGRGCNLVTGPNPWYDDEYFFHCFTGLECIPFEDHRFEGICRRPGWKLPLGSKM